MARPASPLRANRELPGEAGGWKRLARDDDSEPLEVKGDVRYGKFPVDVSRKLEQARPSVKKKQRPASLGETAKKNPL